MGDTFFLFALPSFIEGMASVVDLAGSFHIYNMDPTPKEADFRAIRNDWLVLADDFNASINDIAKECCVEK